MCCFQQRSESPQISASLRKSPQNLREKRRTTTQKKRAREISHRRAQPTATFLIEGVATGVVATVPSRCRSGERLRCFKVGAYLASSSGETQPHVSSCWAWRWPLIFGCSSVQVHLRDVRPKLLRSSSAQASLTDVWPGPGSNLVHVRRAWN